MLIFKSTSFIQISLPSLTKQKCHHKSMWKSNLASITIQRTNAYFKIKIEILKNFHQTNYIMPFLIPLIIIKYGRFLGSFTK